jgi:hypothetical protein
MPGDAVVSPLLHPRSAGIVTDAWATETVEAYSVSLPDGTNYSLTGDHLEPAPESTTRLVELNGKSTQLYTMPRTWSYNIKRRGEHN